MEKNFYFFSMYLLKEFSSDVRIDIRKELNALGGERKLVGFSNYANKSVYNKTYITYVE